MKFCPGKEIAALAEGLISPDKQVRPYGLDLTVKTVSVVKKEGDIDFGGSEEKKALLEKLEAAKRTPQDKYGWWELTAGEYLIEYNENAVIPEGFMGVLQTLPRMLAAGVTHSTRILTPGEKVDNMVLLVGKSGFNIKENARISQLLMLTAITA